MIVYTVETIGGQITSYEANKENLPKFLEKPVKESFKKYGFLNYINENNIVVTSENRDENDTLFACDSVTGNASGSYTFNTWTAEEYLCHNWELLGEALTEFGRDIRCRSVRRYNTLLSVRASNL